MIAEARLASIEPDETDLSWLPAWRIAQLVAERALSPIEITEHFIRRIEALDPIYHAFRKVDFDGALEQARRSEIAITRGEAIGPLHGVPVAVKELIAVRNMPYWDPFVGRHVVADRDALEVERLRKAGAVILGTTIGGLTAREFGDGEGQPANPWDRERVCGDSSSGSACAVAAGLTPIALAADGLGSSRLPAAFCGQVGMLATRGRVASIDWSQLVNRLLSHAGPIARDVRDAATMLSVLAGPDARDLLCLPDTPPDYLGPLDHDVHNTRLAWTPDFGFAELYAGPDSPAIIAAVRQAASNFASDGLEIVETPIRSEDPAYACGKIMLSDPGLAIRQDIGREDVAETRFARARIAAAMTHMLEDQDFILSPTIQYVAPTRMEWATSWQDTSRNYMSTYSAHTAAANLLGWPAISVPAGLFNGMPIGLQITGRPNSESSMLRLAQNFLRGRDFP